MYKLLLVTDRQEVENAFHQVTNWELQGFKPPHVRHDFEGMKESLRLHHADGICLAVSPEEENQIMPWLRVHYPLLSIFAAGETPEEVIFYLNELKAVLNRVRADFSTDQVEEQERFMQCRHEFFRKVITGQVQDPAEVDRMMRLLRSRMDANAPCVLIEVEQPAVLDNRLEGRWTHGHSRLEKALRTSFGGDLGDIHILPTVDPEGRILVLACPLYASAPHVDVAEMERMVLERVESGIQHLHEYQGLELHIQSTREVPSLKDFCKE